MNSRRTLLILTTLALAITLTGCNFPVLTSVDANAEAADDMQTEEEVTNSQPEETESLPTEPSPTEETEPSPEPPTPTPTELPPSPSPEPPACIDRAAFVDDVTIPDGTEIEVGTAFTKTWRLQNIGTCTWSSAYALTFSHGKQMGGPSIVFLSGDVYPDQIVDLSVDLTAPAGLGTHTGYWMLRNANGLLFGLGSMADQPFWVEILAVDPPAADPPWDFPLVPIPQFPFPQILIHTVALDLLKVESGSVYSYGPVLAVENVGDLNNNRHAQVFLSFDISGIPAGANITQVTVDFSDYDTLGDPFSNLGCLRAYEHDYGTLDSDDYHHGMASNAILRWCNLAELSTAAPDEDVLNALEAQLGEDRFQLRVDFNQIFSDFDGVTDMVRLGDLKLIVNYLSPS